MERVLDTHQASGSAVVWGDERWLACGRCEECQAQLEATRDVLLVAGVRTSHRAKLAAVGVHTVEELAARVEPVPELSASSLGRLREQARLQSVQDADPDHAVTAEVHDAETLAVLPSPSPGDIFFDFEGDPMWSEPGSPDWGLWTRVEGGGAGFGLEYLFGVVEAPVDGAEPAFRAFWAHDRAQEKQALVDFLAYVAERRRRWPDLHIYHYAAYERPPAALGRSARRRRGRRRRPAARGVFVDLYPWCAGRSGSSQRSYSLKKLEPLYMGDSTATTRCPTAGDSIVATTRHARLSSRAVRRGAAADREIARTTGTTASRPCGCATGCSTARSKRVSRSAGQPVAGGARGAQRARGGAARVRAGGDRVARARADEQAIAMLAATVQYNRREHKPYWWSHFDRLRNPVDEWVRGSDVLPRRVGRGAAAVGQGGQQRSLRRRLRLDGRFGGGSLRCPMAPSCTRSTTGRCPTASSRCPVTCGPSPVT